MEGLTAPRYINVLNCIDELRPEVVMEIGVLRGDTAEVMIRRMAEFGGKRVYVGFDLFEEPPEYEGSKKGVRSARNVADRLDSISRNVEVMLIVGNTRHTLEQYTGPECDFIFIDGGHSLETIDNDFYWADRHLHEDGVILLDDYYFDRDDIGCKTLVHSLPDRWDWRILEPRDCFPNGLSINMVEVVRKR